MFGLPESPGRWLGRARLPAFVVVKGWGFGDRHPVTSGEISLYGTDKKKTPCGGGFWFIYIADISWVGWKMGYRKKGIRKEFRCSLIRSGNQTRAVSGGCCQVLGGAGRPPIVGFSRHGRETRPGPPFFTGGPVFGNSGFVSWLGNAGGQFFPPQTTVQACSGGQDNSAVWFHTRRPDLILTKFYNKLGFQWEQGRPAFGAFPCWLRRCFPPTAGLVGFSRGLGRG